MHEQGKVKRPWILFGSIALGVIVVGIGVISMIAANWERIPAWFKLLADFSVLAGLGWALLQTRKLEEPATQRNLLLFEACSLAFILLCLASIGLISQVYHTGGQLYAALLFWNAISLPLVLCSRHLLIPLLWSFSFAGALMTWALASPAVRGFFEGDPIAASLLVVLILAILRVIVSELRPNSAQSLTLRFVTLLAGLATLFVADFFGNVWNVDVPARTLPRVLPWVMTGGIGFWLFSRSGVGRTRSILILLVIAAFIAANQLAAYVFENESVLKALASIIVLGLAAAYSASIHARRSFNFLLALIGVRFLVFYFQAFAGLALTGIGLILSGALIVGCALAWNRYRERIFKQVETWIRS